MHKTAAVAYVKEITFRKESKAVRNEFKKNRQQFKQVDQHLEHINRRFDSQDAKLDRMVLMLVRQDADFKEIKETMMTRDLGQKILERIQDLAQKFEEADRSARIRINQMASPDIQK